MDKNAIKKYAVWARRELISRVSQKAMQYGISDVDIVSASAPSVNGVVLSAEEMTQRKALIVQIEAKGYKQVMEEVAYTWFNRFIALRFMEVNGYLPSRVRVFTDENNAFKPQILTEAINLELDGLDMDKVYALKDANNDDALFKYLIITQCNALNPILPGMFQRISDYTELLFPDNLLREGSAVEQMIAMIPEDDWKDAVQIIGWLYQFYNIEPKAEVFGKKSVKISKEEIPAATQLFTPDWIVRYMVENSLGRLWVEGHPNEELKSGWKYYLEEAEQEPDVQEQLAKIRREYAGITPEAIKCIDPCSGSGHILAYMFDVLMQIYEAYGYTTREAVRSIVENNIYGLDIDERAAQLAYFAVMMKARQYDRRFFARKDENGNPDVPQPHVYAVVESNDIDRYALDYFINGDAALKKAMDSIIKEMQDAKEYGSILKITPVDFGALYARFDEIQDDIDMSKDIVMDSLLPLVQVAEAMAQKYEAVVTNPPYMSLSAVDPKLSTYVIKNYPDSKSDLFAVFIERCKAMLKVNGFQAMITMHAWMFLASYENLRQKIYRQHIVSVAHLGPRAFEEISGEIVQTASFVFRNASTQNYRGVYRRLVDYPSQSKKEVAFLQGKGIFASQQDGFGVIPGAPVAYWVSDDFLSCYKNPLISSVAFSDGQILTGNNEKYLRNLWEVSKTSIEQREWALHAKGGEFRRWYGNIDTVVKFDSATISHYKRDKIARFPKDEILFRRGITWTLVSMNPKFGVRELNDKLTFNKAAATILFNNEDVIDYLLGFMNSRVAQALLRVINPTMNNNIKDVLNMPYIYDGEKKPIVERIVQECIALSKEDWDSFETSWDFQKHPLVGRHGGKIYRSYDHDNYIVSSPDEIMKWDYLLSASFESWKNECEQRFAQLKANEEELNRIFIDIYGLQSELSSDVEDKNVTVHLADKKREIKSLISYAVGCMFGRYSLDFPGLVYAGGEWDESKYTTFKADKDSIIPICDDEYFADDIVGRFVRFIEVAFGKATLDENLRFIADALGGSGQPKDVIRNYFLNDFYADHLKMYQKRPIYWLFDSGKKGGFKALVYMHRYRPDTIAQMRTDYVHEQQARYRTAIADWEQRIASASTSERVKLNKRLKVIQEQAAEIQAYEEKIHHLADRYISIDVDEGVKKNYAIFKDVLSPIK